MSSIRSLTAALALAFAIPFAGAHASDDAKEAVSINATSKEAKITPATDSKNPVEKHVAALPGNVATTAKQPVQAKVRLDMGHPQPVSISTKKDIAAPKAFQKHGAALPNSCC